MVESFISSNLAPNFKLKIVGPIEDAALWKKIEKIIDRHESIEYLGFRSGKAKDDLIAGAWSLVLPSRMEAIGMVNLEAAGLGCPSITTYETGLNDWEEGGGILIESNSLRLVKMHYLWRVRGQFREENKRPTKSSPSTAKIQHSGYKFVMGKLVFKIVRAIVFKIFKLNLNCAYEWTTELLMLHWALVVYCSV